MTPAAADPVAGKAVFDTAAFADVATAPESATSSPIFIWNGQEYPIHPLPNETWLLIVHTLDETSGVFREVATELLQKMAGETGELGQNVQSLTGRDVLTLLPALPKVVKSLLPCQSAVVAAGLRLDVDKVANEMSLGKKAEALRLIAQAENLPAVWREFSGLVTMFRDVDVDADRDKIAAASRN